MKLYNLRFAVAFLMMLATILGCEMLAEPHGPVTLDLDYLVFNYLPVILLWLLLFGLSNKSLFSSALSSLVVVGIISVNNIKYEALDKPLMPNDLLLAGHLLKTPGLFIRYIDLTSSLGILVGLAAIAAIYRIEKQQLARTRRVIVVRGLLVAMALTFFTGIPSAQSLVARTYSKNSLSYFPWDPGNSVEQSGFFYTFIRMSEGLDFSIPKDFGDPSLVLKAAAASLPSPGELKRAAGLPDILVVQNEAFYDLRQHELQVAPQGYGAYDRTANLAAVSGKLEVPTVGGNTAKTEFSFLSGVETAVLPSGCEYPYRTLVRQNIWSIAWYLKSLGYATVAIHPYHRTFWDRNIAYPLLGFDLFIDHTEFPKQLREGFFVSDKAVADRMVEVRKKAKGPVFIFAVTMENHGPWDQPRVAKQKQIPVTGDLTAQERTETARYLHHVSHAGEMASSLKERLEQGRRPAVLAFYGDHAPALDLTTRIPFRKGGSLWHTPYFIWRNFGSSRHITRDISVGFLASEILDQAGINYDPYFRAHSYMDNASGGRFDAKSPKNDLNRSYTQLLYNNLLGKSAEKVFTSAKSAPGSGTRL
jgi:phosphoglycerol transferase MdoB-like AlkP superfamily enzyme